MSRSYATFFWKLLPSRFTATEGGELHKLVNGTGAVFDGIKTVLSRARSAFVPATAEEAFLPLHGADRGLPRFTGMTVEAWRALLVSAFELYSLGGTRAGVTKALECLGCEGVEILKDSGYFRHDGSIGRDGRFRYSEQRWASFRVKLKLPDNGDASTMLPLIWAEINRWKKVGTLCSGVEVI